MTTYYFDIGNTRAKFWRCERGMISARAELAHGGDMSALLQALPPAFVEKPAHVRGAAVLAETEQAEFAALVQQRWGLAVAWAESSPAHAGVVSAYKQTPASLGVDRWLALLAVSGRPQPVCVVDCGTAITLDVLAPSGQHLGGYILPGFAMMRTALLQGTKKVAVMVQSERAERHLGDSTATAVCNGALAAVAALTENLAQAYGASVVLTGGDAARLASVLAMPADEQPDLVLRGLQRYFADE